MRNHYSQKKEQLATGESTRGPIGNFKTLTGKGRSSDITQQDTFKDRKTNRTSLNISFRVQELQVNKGPLCCSRSFNRKKDQTLTTRMRVARSFWFRI